MRWYKRLPPFCWSKGYLKFGIIMFILGQIINVFYGYVGVTYGLMFIPIASVFILLFSSVLKPFLMEKTRPCKDCIIRNDPE